MLGYVTFRNGDGTWYLYAVDFVDDQITRFSATSQKDIALYVDTEQAKRIMQHIANQGYHQVTYHAQLKGE